MVLAAANSLRLLKDNDAYEVYYAVLMRQRKSTEGVLAQGKGMLEDPKKIAEMAFEEAIGRQRATDNRLLAPDAHLPTCKRPHLLSR